MPYNISGSVPMNQSIRVASAIVIAALLTSCAGSRQFVAVPSSVDRSHVPTQTIAMTAERFHFTPETIHVKAGTLVSIAVTAKDGTHGFALPAFGIDEKIGEGETKTIEFYAQEK